MLATSERVSPWRARCSARSVGRRTLRTPSSWPISMSRGTTCWSSPRGPLTRTTPGSTETVTPEGTGMGCLPMRDTVKSPYERDDLAPDALATGLVARQDAVRRGHDRGPHAALDTGDVVVRDVVPAARGRDALQVEDDRGAVFGVLQLHVDDLGRLLGGRLLDRVVLDVALLLEDAGHLLLQARGRDGHHALLGRRAVAQAREEVGDGVGHAHGATSSTSSCRGCSRCARGPAGRSGRGRTCGTRHAGGRTCGSACRPASCTSAGAPYGRSWRSWP